MKRVDTAVGSINEFAERTRGTLAKVDGVLDGVDPATGPHRAGQYREGEPQTPTTAAADIAKVTEKFGNRADDIDQMINDARQLTERLNDASVRVDGILAKVDSLLGSGQAEGLMVDASETLKAFSRSPTR